MSKIAVFPGSFDPFTKGHEAVILKSLKVFDKVIVGIGVNHKKQYLFNLENRLDHISEIFKGIENIEVDSFTGLTVDFCRSNNATHIIRGLRDSKDFEYEKSIAQMNFDMSEIETVFFLTDQRYSAISSSIMREIHSNGGDISRFVTNPKLLV